MFTIICKQYLVPKIFITSKALKYFLKGRPSNWWSTYLWKHLSSLRHSHELLLLTLVGFEPTLLHLTRCTLQRLDNSTTRRSNEYGIIINFFGFKKILFSFDYAEGCLCWWKQFQCNVGNKMFNNYSVMVIHKGNHFGEIPYKCFNCGDGFTCISSLKTHYKLHKGQSVYDYENEDFATNLSIRLIVFWFDWLIDFELMFMCQLCVFYISTVCFIFLNCVLCISQLCTLYFLTVSFIFIYLNCVLYISQLCALYFSTVCFLCLNCNSD